MTLETSVLKSYIALLSSLGAAGKTLVDALHNRIGSLDSPRNLRAFLLELLKDLGISSLQHDVIELVDMQDSTLLLAILEDSLVVDSQEMIHRIEAALNDFEIDFVITLFKGPLAKQFSSQSIETLIAMLRALSDSERSDLKEEIAGISLSSFYVSLVTHFVDWLQQSLSDAQFVFFSDLLPLCVDYLQPVRELLESEAYWERILTGSFDYDFILEAISEVDLVLDPCLHLSPVSHMIRFVLFQTFHVYVEFSLVYRSSLLHIQLKSVACSVPDIIQAFSLFQSIPSNSPSTFLFHSLSLTLQNTIFMYRLCPTSSRFSPISRSLKSSNPPFHVRFFPNT